MPALSSPDGGSRRPLDELYRDTVLEHYRRPRNRRPLSDPSGSALVHNPVCGDQVRVEVRLAEDGSLAEVCAISRGCSIAVASGSLMTEIVQGARPDRVPIQQAALARLVEEGEAGGELDPRLQPFARVCELPSRRRCALLPWEALAAALAQAQGGGAKSGSAPAR